MRGLSPSKYTSNYGTSAVRLARNLDIDSWEESGKRKSGRGPVYTRGGGVLVDLIKYYAHKAHAMKGSNLLFAAGYLISKILKEREERLLFKNGLPTRGFVRCFQARRKGRIYLGWAKKQEETRCNSRNARALVGHILTFENLFREHNLDPSR